MNGPPNNFDACIGFLSAFIKKAVDQGYFGPELFHPRRTRPLSIDPEICCITNSVIDIFVQDDLYNNSHTSVYKNLF